MADDFVQKFVSLSSRQDRVQALNKLISLLSPDERREALEAIDGKNDLIPALPFELLLQVFSHLRIQEAWSLQRVNRRWRNALSSDHFLRSTLLRFNTHDPSDSGRSAESIANDSVRDRILHMRSLKLGKPFSLTEFDDTGIDLPGPRPRLAHRKLGFKGKRIAYISSKPGECDTIVLRDLESGSVQKFYGEARERIDSLALSTELISFVTFDGYLNVVKFAEPAATFRRRLPSVDVRALGTDGSLVAVAMGESGSTDGRLHALIIFDASSGKMTGLDFQEGFDRHRRERNKDLSLLVDSQQRCVDIFTFAPYYTLEKRGILDVLHLRANILDGTFSEVSCLTRELPQDGSSDGLYLTMAPPIPTGCRGYFRIKVWESPHPIGAPRRLRFDAFFHWKDGSEWDEGQKVGFVDELPLRTFAERVKSPYPAESFRESF